ncbi:MAG: ABC transporter ATP-binding protein/permease [Oscillospiraceae bacterium]|nr:ABC transporter ATP-binding protein/permease [Oscillospiraceae bacterium]
MTSGKTASFAGRIFFLLGKIWKFDRPRIFLDIAGQISGNIEGYIFHIAYPLYIYTAAQGGNDFFVIFKYVSLALLAFFALKLYSRWHGHYYTPASDIKIMESVNKEIFVKSAQMDIANYENPEFYEKFNRTINNVNEKFLSFKDNLLDCVFSLIYVLLTAAIMTAIDAFVAIFVFAPIILYIIVGAKINNIRYEYNMLQMNENRRKSYVNNAFCSKEFSKEIRLTRISKVLLGYFEKAFGNSIANVKKFGYKTGRNKALFALLGRYLIHISALVYITYKAVVAKTINVGEFYFLLFSIVTLSWSFTGTIQNILKINDDSLYINDYIDFLTQKPSIVSLGNIKEVDLKNMSIEFKDVSFKYPGSDVYVLKHISLSINMREKTAFVGYNGAGKTTIVKLMLRLYDATEGEILLNGIDIKNFELDFYRQLFGVVFQDFQIYALSVADNIALGSEYALDEIAEAAKKAGILAKIETYPNGLQSLMTKEFDNGGIVPSGGEEQKLAIARNFCHDRKVAIFDEPSSFLDPYAEKMLLEQMIAGSEDKITIFISHRLSSATLADRIFLIADGCLVEQGSHGQLMGMGGKYKEIFSVQAKNYIEAEEAGI